MTAKSKPAPVVKPPKPPKPPKPAKKEHKHVAYSLTSKTSGDVLISAVDGSYVFRNEALVVESIRAGGDSEPVVYATEGAAAQVAGSLGIPTLGKEIVVTREGNVGRITSYVRTARVPVEYAGRPPFQEH